MATNLVCKIHPVVLFSIVDSYDRRNEDSKRVIGTLLGTADKGTVEVTNCFMVPHNESDDQVAIDIDFAKNMCDLHRKVNATETVVGWYSTGNELNEYSVLIHEYYCRETKNPIHLTVDTGLKGNHLGCKAFLSTAMGVPGGTMGTMFTPLPIEIIYYEAEKVGVEFAQLGKMAPKKTINLVSDLNQISATCSSLQEMLKNMLNYVEGVIAGQHLADPLLGRKLMQLVNSVPKLSKQEFDQMLSSNITDLLMVTYLSKLANSQVLLNEKMNLI